ncbi:uncharacterized protein LOC133420783 isoform X1 [Cololabis saira]|uniref:uncharacterized protein LOC133420783 isoform X1 n=1 Tax=Cololabis saira TaxID=129043 RepID=UPI002AD2F87B|nr:uncharacterized protein LOC133420783 isoform X1 [Cololabis saira]
MSPSWLSPGVSVTLSCEVKHPSAGWSFYWYKALPQLPNLSCIYELLPGSTSGTAQDSYIIDGQTHTAGYACRAGRGDPVIYTPYSQTKMVWSADPHPSASLTVSPDRVQHFSSDSVSLTCEGNSTEWRVRRSTLNNYTTTCSYWGTMIRSTCVINRLQHSNTVFWCESGSAFSNAVNITGQNNDGIILVNPVHPVTEGASVSLSCRLRGQNLLSSVFFYHNDKPIPNDGRGELNISAVSRSHEGFYKCEHSGNVSPQSWMAVKSVSRTESSSFLFLVWLLVPVILLSFLLLLLCLYKKSKDSCCIRWIQSDSSSQNSTTNQPVNQPETVEYDSLLHGSVDVYETIRPSGDTGTGNHHKQEEDAVYINMKTRTAGSCGSSVRFVSCITVFLSRFGTFLRSSSTFAKQLMISSNQNKGKEKKYNKKVCKVYIHLKVKICLFHFSVLVTFYRNVVFCVKMQKQTNV